MIKDISTAIIAELGTLFTEKLQFANPYDLTKNASQVLKEGFGVKMGAGSLNDFDSSVFTVMERKFDVIVTKGFFASDVSHSLRQSCENDLMDECESAVSALKQSTDIKELVTDIDYEADSGINLLESGKLSILIQTITMSVRYKRSI